MEWTGLDGVGQHDKYVDGRLGWDMGWLGIDDVYDLCEAWFALSEV